MPSRLEEITRLRGEGWTQAAIAALFGLSQPRVSQILSVAGHSHSPAVTARQVRDARILRHRGEGLPAPLIAARVGASVSTVFRVLRGADTDRAAATKQARARAGRACSNRFEAWRTDILDAWADGLGQYDLHLLTGRSEGAIRQILLRARRRGDPRAVRRDSASRAEAARAA